MSGPLKISSELVSIKKLESPAGWIEWKKAINDTIHVNGLGDLIEDEKEEPQREEGETDLSLSKRIKIWKLRQRQMVTYIKLQLGDTARAEVEEELQIHIILEKLEAMFKPRGSAIFRDLDASSGA